MIGDYRSHLAIQMEILEMIAVERHDPYLSTQILWKTQLNSTQVMKYLREMEKKGFLTKEPIAHVRVAKSEYKITENGRIVLNAWLQFLKTWELVVTLAPVTKLHTNHT